MVRSHIIKFGFSCMSNSRPLKLSQTRTRCLGWVNAKVIESCQCSVSFGSSFACVPRSFPTASRETNKNKQVSVGWFFGKARSSTNPSIQQMFQFRRY